MDEILDGLWILQQGWGNTFQSNLMTPVPIHRAVNDAPAPASYAFKDFETVVDVVAHF